MRIIRDKIDQSFREYNIYIRVSRISGNLKITFFIITATFDEITMIEIEKYNEREKKKYWYLIEILVLDYYDEFQPRFGTIDSIYAELIRSQNRGEIK